MRPPIAFTVSFTQRLCAAQREVGEHLWRGAGLTVEWLASIHLIIIGVPVGPFTKTSRSLFWQLGMTKLPPALGVCVMLSITVREVGSERAAGRQDYGRSKIRRGHAGHRGGRGWGVTVTAAVPDASAAPEQFNELKA